MSQEEGDVFSQLRGEGIQVEGQEVGYLEGFTPSIPSVSFEGYVNCGAGAQSKAIY